MTPSFQGGAAYPRRQADYLAQILGREGDAFHGVVAAKRGQGKTDLLRQIHFQMFQRAEGAIPVFYSFRREGNSTQARRFLAGFCQHVRAFLMRREELLWEPATSVEQELQRPGLPLALTELAAGLESTPGAAALDFIATLPGQFAHRERRPVCLLLDDVEELGQRSPFFDLLTMGEVRWLLSGRQPYVLSLAGDRGWPLISVEAFSRREALTLIEKKCVALGVPFFRDIWQRWTEIAGTSPLWAAFLIHAAAVESRVPESVETLGQIYGHELAGGALGNWFSARWQRALPDRRERGRIAEFLTVHARFEGAAIPASALGPALWDGLVAEEWAEETPVGLRMQLDVIHQDWLRLLSGRTGAPLDRLASRGLQTFLVHAAEQQSRAAEPNRFQDIREYLLRVPHTGFPPQFDWGEGIPPIRACEVVEEARGTDHLFWCYGLRRAEEREYPCILLVVLVRNAPAVAQVDRWHRVLDDEARLLPAAELQGIAASADQFARELWLLVPPGAPLSASRSERRFSWETFPALFQTGESSLESPAADPRR